MRCGICNDKKAIASNRCLKCDTACCDADTIECLECDSVFCVACLPDWVECPKCEDEYEYVGR